jgi:putative FmdB family regulatory protein
MPIYEYQCDHCRYYVELMQKISDKPLRKCPSCGRNTLKKLVSAPAFRLKGSGWYETDFKSEQERKRNLVVSEERSESKAAAEPSTDSKAEAKAEGAAASAAKPAESKPEAKRESRAHEGKVSVPLRGASSSRPRAAAKSGRAGASGSTPSRSRAGNTSHTSRGGSSARAAPRRASKTARTRGKRGRR